MTAPEWRDCADPDELAAAVAAGVEVLRMRGGGCDGTSDGPTREEAAMNEVPTYQPPEGVHGPTLGRDLPDGCERLRATWDPHTAFADHWLASGAAVDEYLYWWRPVPLVADAVLAVLPTPLPVPPWPGAVLSGLVDEDGEPTWLAQAGQVRGEQVRGWRDVAWYRPDGHSSDTWVEVRAPRAVPEPETERVPVWEAVDRWMPGGRVICGWQWSTQTRDGSVTHDDGTFTPVHDAPTVEVLKDGGQ